MSEWSTIDKSGWGRGPWQDEPDKVHWVDEATDLDCLIVRGPHGALCGYVGVPEGHPDYQKGYDDVPVEVHGGLTFADGCHEATPEKWEKIKAAYPGWQAEAVKYPNGDSAERVRDFAEIITSYPAFQARNEARAICHVPLPGRSDKVWWLGFDCAHYLDFSPKYDKSYPQHDAEYRDLRYVRREVTQLAAQLRERAVSPESQ